MTEVKTELVNDVSASFQATPVEGAPEGTEVLGGVIYKGDVSGGKEGAKGFQAVVNGVSGAIRKGFKAAIVDALESAGVSPKVYDVPGKWSDVYVSNKEPEIESLDDLSKEDKAAFEKSYKALNAALAKDVKAIEARRKVNFEIASTFVGIRDSFSDSHKWSLFKKLAPDAVLKDFLGKNTAGEFYRAGRLLAVDGFDADAMVPEKVSGAKGVCTAYNTMIATVAGNAVAYAHNAAYCKKLKISGNDATRIRAVIADMVSEGEFNPEDIEGAKELDEQMHAMAMVLIPAHLNNWDEEKPQVLDIAADDAKVTVLRDEETKRPVVRTIFGLEGADELVSAVARELSKRLASVAQSKAASSVESATSAMVKEAKATETRFADWDADKAARHLANVLFAGWNDEAAEDEMAAQRGRIDEILSKMGAWADAIFAENATIADLLSNEPTPESVEDAEDEADAAINS